MADNYDVARRFGGIARIYGDAALQRFQQAHVCVIGVGGVGSWVVEALARSGIGTLTLIDLDNVAESNINRQLPALGSTLGAAKVDVLAQRIADINPACHVHCIEDFVTPENIPDYIHAPAPDSIDKRFDYVIDCIDSFRVKTELIAYCKRHKVRIITLGGAGGQRDPSKIRLTDLSRSQHDPLLSKIRKQLRQEHHFTRNPKRKFDVPCVWSAEQMIFPDGKGGTSPERPGDTDSSGLSCAGGLGSIMTVTSTFAQFAVAHVLEKLSTRP